MTKFFRKIREKLLAEKRLRKYLLYAIGEIVLVVIGILIALALNSWNTQRLEQQEVISYYEKTIEELKVQLDHEKYSQQSNDSLITSIQNVLNAINTEEVSKLENVKGDLGALGTGWTEQRTFPIINEFISKGFLSKVKNEELKEYYSGILYAKKWFTMVDQGTRNKYETIIEPYFNKNINYAEVAHPETKHMLIEGGPPTPYHRLINDLEFWNVLTFKLESLKENESTHLAFIKYLQKFISILEKETEKG